MKMTNATALTYVLSNCELPMDVQERVQALCATLEKRAEKAKLRERKPTAKELAKREENSKLGMQVLESLTAEGQLCATLAEQHNVSTAKMAAILRKLEKDGLVTCTVVKRKTLWQRAQGTAEEEGE